MANGLQTLLAALAGAGQGASSWVDERRTRQRQDAADALAQENMRRQWEMLTRQQNRDEVLQTQAEARENRLEDVAKQNAAVESYGKLIPSAPAVTVGDQELLGPQRGSEVPRPRASLYEKYGLPLQGGELTGVRPGASAPPLTLSQGLKLPDTPGPPVSSQASPISLPSQRLGTPNFNPLTRPASGTDLQNRLQQAQTQFSLAEGAKNSGAPLRAARALQMPTDQRAPEDIEAIIQAGLGSQLNPTISESQFVTNDNKPLVRDAQGTYRDPITKEPYSGPVQQKPPGSILYPDPSKGSLSENQQLLAYTRLTKQWDEAVAPAVEMQRQRQLMRAGLDAVRKGGWNAGSQAILVTFQKVLDPSSVVRESEYARSPAGLSLLSRIEGAYKRLEQGGAGVPAADLQQFVDLADGFVNQANNSYLQDVKKRITGTASRFQLDPDLIFTDPFSNKPTSQPPGTITPPSEDDDWIVVNGKVVRNPNKR